MKYWPLKQCITHTRKTICSNFLKNLSTFSLKSTSTTMTFSQQMSTLVHDMLPNVNPTTQSKVLNGIYLPVYSYIMEQRRLSLTNANNKRQPTFIGLSAPQGCGKTTLVEAITKCASLEGLNCVSMSLDDFYLTGDQQDRLATKHEDNPLLRFRGNAGTHDLPLLSATLQALARPTDCDDIRDSTSTVMVPRYDKSLRSGRGDRADTSRRTAVTRPVDIVLVEGWMLGFSPLPPSEDCNSDGSLVDTNFQVQHCLSAVNAYLTQYEPVHSLFDAWVVLAVQDVNHVYRWRLEAEQRMRNSGRSGMTDEQVADFVSRFMPAYNAYLSHLYVHGPQRRPGAPVLKITVDGSRLPVAVEEEESRT